MRTQLTAIAILAVTAAGSYADVRVGIRLGAGHPMRRPGRTVVVRRRPVVVRPPRVVFVAPRVWVRSTIVLPPRDRLVWQDSETIFKREDWVDTELTVNTRGERLVLRVNGKAQIDFAEVYFDNEQVQVVDFHEDTLESGTYPLLDFADGRRVNSVRVIARAQTGQAKLTVAMVK